MRLEAGQRLGDVAGPEAALPCSGLSYGYGKAQEDPPVFSLACPCGCGKQIESGRMRRMAVTQGAGVSGNFVIQPPGIWPASHCRGGQLLAPSRRACEPGGGEEFPSDPKSGNS